MILYLDTSALVKVYIHESNSDKVRKAFLEADVIAISNIGYVEFHSAIGRLVRENFLDKEQLSKIVGLFENNWANHFVVNLNSSISIRASELVYKSELRAFDSIHLATAEYIKLNFSNNLIFACFDNRLVKAVGLLDMELL